MSTLRVIALAGLLFSAAVAFAGVAPADGPGVALVQPVSAICGDGGFGGGCHCPDGIDVGGKHIPLPINC